jgi:hypothetical protein
MTGSDSSLLVLVKIIIRPRFFDNAVDTLTELTNRDPYLAACS